MSSAAAATASARGSRDIEPDVTFRPMLGADDHDAAAHQPRPSNDAQWIGLVTDTTDHYVFGRIDQTTVALTVRLNYTMTPNLSLQLYAQPFVSGGDYSGVQGARRTAAKLDYTQRYTPYAYDIAANGDPDFNVKSFRTTNVLRWEYKPGSTLFVVWQQARENDAVPGGFSASAATRTPSSPSRRGTCFS